MADGFDLVRLKTQIEAAMETLLRAADARVSWKQPAPPPGTHSHSTEAKPVGSSDHAADAKNVPAYTFIPGVYSSVSNHSSAAGALPSSGSSASASHAHVSSELSDGELRVVLHGDNTFEYAWSMKRSAPRAMEFSVEMVGEWRKPVLNRSRRDEDDQRVFLSVKMMRFHRLSNYDAETGAWKLCLKTLTRHDSDWAVVGETERGVPPIAVVFACTSAGLESTGAALASHVLSNSPACRVLAGLTKKIANKLGAPIDVMTDRWLPARHVVLARAPASEQRGVRAFSPLFCLAEALLQQRQPQQTKEQQPESALDLEQSHNSIALILDDNSDMMMQRNEVDATLTASEMGLGSPELWQRLRTELDGKTVLETPHVSKKVLLKAVRLQADAMRSMVDEFDRLRDKMSEMEREAKHAQKYVERVNTKVLTLQGQCEETNTKVYELEVAQSRQLAQLDKLDDVVSQVEATRDDITRVQQRVDGLSVSIDDAAAQTAQDLAAIRQEQDATKQFAMQLEDRMDTDEKELFLDSDHILHHKLSLAMWIDVAEQTTRKQDDALRESTERMAKQGKNVEAMLLATRRTLDDNTCAVEDVQRLVLEKADRTRVDEAIESKYEEICNQLDKALASMLGDEDEFKRVSRELQALVTHLSETKADKKDLLDVKEQVLYDARVRQQVENLRSFLDLKMNRDDVVSMLKNKADKDEMLALLQSLSEGMNASIVQAQKTFGEPETAFLTHKSALAHSHAHGGANTNSQKRSGVLPSLEKEKCLSCNSTLREPASSGSSSSGPLSNKTPHQMTPVFGGGFALGSPAAPVDKSSAMNRISSNSSNNNNNSSHHNHNHSTSFLPGAGGGVSANASSSGRIASLSDSASEGFLLGVDGHVYQGDPEILATRAVCKIPHASTNSGSGSGSGSNPRRRSASSLSMLDDGVLPDIGSRES